MSSALATKIVLHFVVITRKSKSQHAFVRFKNEPPRQARATLVKMLAQLPYRQSGMRVRLAKTLHDQAQCCRHFMLPLRIPHDFPEPFGEFNGNHFCSR